MSKPEIEDPMLAMDALLVNLEVRGSLLGEMHIGIHSAEGKALDSKRQAFFNDESLGAYIFGGLIARKRSFSPPQFTSINN